jgi:hypothetical protein
MALDPWETTELGNSFQRNKPRGMGGIDTGPRVLGRLVRDGELCKIVVNHIRIDLNLVEGLAIADTNNASNHLRDNDHVAEMGLHGLWLLTYRNFLYNPVLFDACPLRLHFSPSSATEKTGLLIQ